MMPIIKRFRDNGSQEPHKRDPINETFKPQSFEASECVWEPLYDPTIPILKPCLSTPLVGILRLGWGYIRELGVL